MTETTERFLQEIAARVGYDRVAELYLFPVLRQGGVEGAVAVVAAYPEPEASEPEASELEASELQVAPEATPEPTSDAADGGPISSGVAEPKPVDPAVPEGGDAVTVEPGVDEQAQDDQAHDDGERTATEPRPRARHVVYTARYRHTIKGTDRGRWIVEVVAEADAPLITVEEVVRGVVRRSGDAFQPERISGEQFRAIVPAPAAPGSVPA